MNPYLPFVCCPLMGATYSPFAQRPRPDRHSLRRPVPEADLYDPPYLSEIVGTTCKPGQNLGALRVQSCRALQDWLVREHPLVLTSTSRHDPRNAAWKRGKAFHLREGN